MRLIPSGWYLLWRKDSHNFKVTVKVHTSNKPTSLQFQIILFLVRPRSQTMQTFLWVAVWTLLRTRELLSTSPWPNHRSSCPRHQISPEAGTRWGKTPACWWNEGQGKLQSVADDSVTAPHQNLLPCSQLLPPYQPRHSGASMPNQLRFSEVLVKKIDNIIQMSYKQGIIIY